MNIATIWLALALSSGDATATAPAPAAEILSNTQEAGKGVPNGSSADPQFLTWLKPGSDPEYGYTQEKPVLIGGLLEGKGSRWSAQYFASLLGPGGEPTTFERIGSCCGFALTDPKLVDEGFKRGFLDAYRVTVEGKPSVVIYVSLYEEQAIFAPVGFTPRKEAAKAEAVDVPAAEAAPVEPAEAQDDDGKQGEGAR